MDSLGKQYSSTRINGISFQNNIVRSEKLRGRGAPLDVPVKTPFFIRFKLESPVLNVLRGFVITSNAFFELIAKPQVYYYACYLYEC